MKFFKKFKEILEKNGLPAIEQSVRVYYYLLNNAIEGENQLEQINLYRDLFFLDSMNNLNKELTREYVIPNFSISKLKKDRDFLKKKLNKRSAFLNYAIVAAALFFFGFGYYIFKYRQSEKRLRETLRSDITVASPKTAIGHSNLEPVMEKLLVRLDEWEQNLGFLDRTITQKTLAEQLDSNDTYLSKLVNEYKELSFSNYVKDLRITYCINDLKNNPKKLGNKSTILVAEAYGFNSLDVFSRTLKAKIGATPSQFFKQIRKRSPISNSDNG